MSRKWTRPHRRPGRPSLSPEILACDFLTVETVRLKTLYVLVWIELHTRTVRLGGLTTNPDSAWVIQQARNLVMNLQEEGRDVRFFIHDRDSKFTASSTRCSPRKVSG